MASALFIVFEGIDGSGTTTQSGLLAEYITSLGHAVVYTREPGGTALAEKIRALVLDPSLKEMCDRAELLLYAASRAQHVQELIGPALKAGKPVVCDRYAASTLAYQGFGRGLDLPTIERLNRLATGGTLPDLTIYLELPLAEAESRRKSRAGAEDRMEQEGIEFQKRVAKGFGKLAEQAGEKWLRIDATESAERQSEHIQAVLKSRWSHFPFKKR